MTVITEKKHISVPILLLQTAAAALAWAGAGFSPGFSEGLAAVFVIAGAVMLLFPRTASGRILFLAGALCVPAGTYIYAAGEDHLTSCVWISLIGTACVYAVLCMIPQKKKTRPGEHLLRAVLLFNGLFSLLCGIFSTALLLVGIGVLLCFSARYTQRTFPWLTIAGLLLCDVFLLTPMVFGGVP